jgi:large subunit ribosomal protein L2
LNQNFKNFIVGFNYDPNRTSHLAQICAISQKENFYLKTYKYILAPQNLKILDTMNNDNVNIDTNLTTKQIGNCYLLKDLNIGDFIYNIQINKYKTAQLVRAGGTFATILQKNENFATIKLPSNEIRNVPLTYTAFLGNLSNQDHIKKS